MAKKREEIDRPFRAWNHVAVVEGPSYETSYMGKGELRALTALSEGVANEEQQKRALDAILINICGMHDLSFFPDEMGGERATAFAEGKRYVASQIMKLLNHQSEYLK